MKTNKFEKDKTAKLVAVDANGAPLKQIRKRTMIFEEKKNNQNGSGNNDDQETVGTLSFVRISLAS